MAYIPEGALVAGTPADRLPRLADEEMSGEQMILDGFYIDEFPYPNEEGAIPLTNVSRDEARRLCAEQGKRLCSELEWERACKGPDNLTYEYGEKYRESVCKTGRQPGLRPSGFTIGCESAFGVKDMHGGGFEWTDSPWGRGSEREAGVLRGGNDRAGELVGRCANARRADPEQRSGIVGFRCCAGPRNDEEVSLHLAHGPGLLPRARFDETLEKALIDGMPEEARTDLRKVGVIRPQRAWLWRPIGNEELHALAVCARGGGVVKPRCGIIVGRVSLGRVDVLTFGSTGVWVPNLLRQNGVRDLWLIGGDQMGSFKRHLAYRWGQVHIGELSRGVPKKG